MSQVSPQDVTNISKNREKLGEHCWWESQGSTFANITTKGTHRGRENLQRSFCPLPAGENKTGGATDLQPYTTERKTKEQISKKKIKTGGRQNSPWPPADMWMGLCLSGNANVFLVSLGREGWTDLGLLEESVSKTGKMVISTISLYQDHKLLGITHKPKDIWRTREENMFPGRQRGLWNGKFAQIKERAELSFHLP